MEQAPNRLDEVRQQARQWVAENFPASLRTVEMQEHYYKSFPKYPEGGDWDVWKRRMVEAGWGAPGWPRQYGGGGLDTAAGLAVAQEIFKAGAFNPMTNMGLSMLGPTLLEFGNDEQKERHIPRITRGEVRWCQGFSEPGAGSDLASLRTRAEDRGDHYLVNGQKVWTTGAVYADWCFCLVRTDLTKKHEGISFLMIDMKTPGVEVRPIRLISGYSPFSEVFFTDVKVPKENLVGREGAGWTIAKRLLQHERNAVNANRPRFGGDLRPLEVIAKDYLGVDAEGRIAAPELRGRIVRHMMDVRALALMQARIVEEGKANRGPSEATSVVKNARARVQQEREELLVEIMGWRGLGHAGEGFTEMELDNTKGFLSNKAMTIYSGTTEVQNNIIAKRMLGLPDMHERK